MAQIKTSTPFLEATQGLAIHTEPFEHKEYDITPCFCYCCPLTLILEPEYLFLNQGTCCGDNKMRMAYADVNVDVNQCCCFVSVNGWSPGLGCETDTVHEIATELQQRVGRRGNTGQIQRSEETLELMQHLTAKIDRMEQKLDQALQLLQPRS